MAEVQKGFFWHVHHRVLLEWCYDYDGRASFISEQKREDQKETRLRLFKPVKGKLPQEVVEAGRVLDKAWHAYDEAGRASDKAWQAYYETQQAYYETQQAYNEASQAYNRARQALDEALHKNMSAIEALHREECHDCPWNGKTIFPNA